MDNFTFEKTKICTKCNQEKSIALFRLRGEGKSYGKHHYQHCRECEKSIAKVTREAKKECTIPKPTHCDMCGRIEDIENQKNSRIVFDHDHITGKFRGWICDSCNRGLSNLGDNIEGLQKGIIYLNGGNKCL